MSSAAARANYPALVLNADYRPLSYYPLSLWAWQDVVKAALLERVNIVCEYDATVRSPSMTIRLPSVVCLQKYVLRAERPAFTRFNVFLRDSFTCQYCGVKNDLTFDHLIPRARGGRTIWTNVVTACAACNLRKSDKICPEIGMQPRQAPYMPTAHDLQRQGRRFPPGYLHESWQDFLYWDVSLEP